VHDFDLLTARSLAEIEQMLADTHGKILAGGTDLILFMEMGRLQPATVIDISRIEALRYIRADAGTVRIGPLTTHAALAASPVLREWAPILPLAAATVGAVQIRNRGTVGGNLGTASPAADTIPAFMALGAHVTLRSRQGQRRLALEQFFSGPGKTVAAADEYIAEIDFPTPPACGRGVYYKAGRRKAQAITLVSVGAQVTPHRDGPSDVRIALGAVAPTVIRAISAEQLLHGRSLAPDVIEEAARLAARDARPIDDVRASADYRRRLVQTWTRRALHACM
jgi:CO/xanthine dehydrogenase FAD-binding subunit